MFFTPQLLFYYYTPVTRQIIAYWSRI